MNYADALRKVADARQAMAHGALWSSAVAITDLMLWNPIHTIPLLKQLWITRSLVPRSSSVRFFAWVPQALTHSPGNIEAYGVDCVLRMHEPSILISRDHFYAPKTGDYQARAIFTCETEYTLADCSIGFDAVRLPDGTILASTLLTPKKRAAAINLRFTLQSGDSVEFRLHWDGRSCSTFAGTWTWLVE